MIFFGTINDQIFLGPYNLFKKVILFVDNINDFYLLKDIQKEIRKHNSRRKNNPKLELNMVKFPNESEILLWKYINIQLNKEDYLINEPIHFINTKNN